MSYHLIERNDPSLRTIAEHALAKLEWELSEAEAWARLRGDSVHPGAVAARAKAEHLRSALAMAREILRGEAELAQLRARLAAAEAVIAALPRCSICDEPATWESDDVSVEGACDARDHEGKGWNEYAYAEPLRAWLAIVGDKQ